MKKILDYLKTNQTQILRGIIVLWGIYLVVRFVSVYAVASIEYREWTISEWMINYEGGFVRRGLIGQLLYELFQLYPYPINFAIIIICFVSFIGLIVLLVRLFNREGWSCVLLFTPVLFEVTFRWDLFWNRRDHLALIITWAIFYCYSRYINKHKTGFMIIMQVLSIFTLLMHEASFFFTFPILFFHYYNYKRSQLKSVYKSIVSTTCFSIPIMITMAVVCLNKGNADIANAIWNSWQPFMVSFPSGNVDKLGCAIEPLCWNSNNTFELHFKMNWFNFFGNQFLLSQ